MTKGKSTKKALLGSVTALVLSCLMLVGTTFAWFTDTETSGKNRITAGNLDVGFQYATGFEDGTGAVTTWADVTTTSADLFRVVAGDQKNLWEPGHAEVAYVKVSNLGTLALKYRLSMNVDAEKKSKNVNDVEFKLSDYLMYNVVDLGTTADVAKKYATRDAAIAAATPGAKKVSDANTNIDTVDVNSILNPVGETAKDPANSSERYLAVVVWMPTTVENEANYKTGVDAPTIDLGVKLTATQAKLEKDSFGTEYDETLPMPSDPTGAAVTPDPVTP